MHLLPEETETNLSPGDSCLSLLILLHLDYCSVVWGNIGTGLSKRLE